MAVQQGPVRPRGERTMDNFDMEVSFGVPWVSLNDRINFRVSAEGFGNKVTQQRRITADSPYFDGTYLVHSTKDNVTEEFAVYVYGSSQNHVTENLLLLEEIFDQAAYRIRLRFDDHQETWSCQTADYSVERSHVFMHNVMAVMKFQVPRFPKISYEAIL